MYICPMHSEIRSEHPASCQICGMALVEQSKMTNQTSEHNSYRPLLIIIGLIWLVATLSALAFHGGWLGAIKNFMAGFFLVFGGFKLIDLPGFAEGYAQYDLLARRFKGYGFMYPFIELTLGLAILIGSNPLITNGVTLLVMTFSGLGVALKLRQHQRFQCACLGTFLKIPLTKVTLVEDFGMAAMAAMMLLMK